MSMNTEYGGKLIEWSLETWTLLLGDLIGDASNIEQKVKDGLLPSDVKKQSEDILYFQRCFLDPRLEWYGGHAMKVKDHWFWHFQQWALKKYGKEILEQEPAFMSMSICGGRGFSIEDMKRIKNIEFKE